MARLELIVSPVSGSGKSVKRLPEQLNYLTKSGADIRSTVTRGMKHARELAEQAVTDKRVAVAVGGDGLVSCVAQVVSEGGGTLGIVPGGRGNDFARALGIDEFNALDKLIAGQTRSVDLGAIGDRTFTSVASFGFDSSVVEIANGSKAVPGRWIYPYAAVSALRRWKKPAEFEIELDGERIELRGFSVAVANAPMFGGGMKIAPDASLDDGHFDVIAITDMPKLSFLFQLPRVMKGSHIESRYVETWRATKVRLNSWPDFEVVADGELVGKSPVDIEIRPRALNVVV